MVWVTVLVAHPIIAPGFKFSYQAGIAIDLLILAFFIGEFAVLGIDRPMAVDGGIRIHPKVWHAENFRIWLNRSIIALIGISFVGSLIYFYRFYLHFGSLGQLLTAGWAVRGALASGEIAVPLGVRIPALLAFSALNLSLCYWILFQFRWYLLLPVISMTIMGIAQAGRAATLMMLIMIFVAQYWKDKYQGKKAVGSRFLRRSILFALLILIVFVLGQSYRDQAVDMMSMIEGHTGVYQAYLMGAISGFSEFWLRYSSGDDLKYGQYMFSALVQLLGISNLPLGYYDEYLGISWLNDAAVNIYTLFRNVVDDYGFSGALVFMFLLGMIFALVYRGACRGNVALLSVAIMAYTMIVYSIFAPLTQHNTILLSFAVPPLAIFWINNRLRNVEI